MVAIYIHMYIVKLQVDGSKRGYKDVQWNLCRHLGTSQKCPYYQGVLIFQVSLHDNVSFGTTDRCVDYAGVHIFKCPD